MQDDETKKQSYHQQQYKQGILEFKQIVQNFTFNIQKLKILEQKLKIIELLVTMDISMFRLRQIVDCLRLLVVRLFDYGSTGQIQLNLCNKEIIVGAIVSIGQCLLTLTRKRGEGGVSSYKVFVIVDKLWEYFSIKSECLFQQYQIISQQQVNSIISKLETSDNLIIGLCLASKNKHFSPKTQTQITAFLWKYHQKTNKDFAQILKNILQSKYSFETALDQLSNKKKPNYRQFFIKLANSKCKLTSNVSIAQLSFIYAHNYYQFSDVFSLLTQEDLLDQNGVESKMCAILNSGGGYLLIGFSQINGGCLAEGMLLSKNRKQQLQKQIRKCFEYIQPKQYCSIGIHFLPILPNPLSKQQESYNREIGRIFIKSKQNKIFYSSEKKGSHFKTYRFRNKIIIPIREKQIYAEILKRKSKRYIEQPSSPLCIMSPKQEVEQKTHVESNKILLFSNHCSLKFPLKIQTKTIEIISSLFEKHKIKYLLYCPKFHSVNLVNKAYWIIGYEDPYLTIFKLLKDINPNFQIDVKQITNYIQFRISNVQVSKSPHQKLINLIQQQYAESTIQSTIKMYKSTHPLNQKNNKYKFNAINAKKFNIQNNYIYWQIPDISIVFLIQAISLEQNTQIRFIYLSKQQFMDGKNNKLLVQIDCLNINGISN